MKKITHCSLLLLFGAAASLAQTPVFKPVQQIPNVRLQNLPVITRTNALTRYDANARVKYIINDATRMNEVTGRLPQMGDYITLGAMVGGKEYTLVPQSGLNIESSATGVQNMQLQALVPQSSMPSYAPRTQSLWKVTLSGNGLALNYNGPWLPMNPGLEVTGGFLGFQAGQVKIANSAAALSTAWRMQLVSEGGTNYLRVQNTADNNLLGYTYNTGATMQIAGNNQTIIGNFIPAVLTPENCNGHNCDIKWIFKIYRPEKLTQVMYSAPVLPGTYFINVAYGNKSMLPFGPIPVFGFTNAALPDMQWQLEQTSRGTYFIFNKKSGKALGVNPADNHFVFNAIDTGNFYATDNMQWVIRGPFEGKYSFAPLMDQQHPNATLDLTCSNGVAVSMQPYTPGSYWQEFIIDSVNGPLWGYVDMHTHPMSHLAFAGKNFHGAPDIGSLMLAHTIYADAGFDVGETKPDCNSDSLRVTNVSQALGVCNAVHGGPGTDNNCGDLVRNTFVTAMEKMTDGAYSAHGKAVYGYSSDPTQAFVNWPRWNDMTHQKMWVDWIEAAYKSGLRVMVALTHNNRVMAEIIAHNDATPKDDVSSADMQIREIIKFVGRHPGFMEIAYTPADLYRIIKSNRLAVIPGIEADYLGDFPINMPDNADSRAKVDRELDRLYANGVRYIFPIHLSDNAFGGTAIYEGMANLMQKVGTNTSWNIQCSAPADSIDWKYKPLLDSRIRDGLQRGLPIAPAILEAVNQLLPFPPGVKEIVTPILSGIIASAALAGNTAGQAALSVMPDNPPDCGTGHRNAKQMTDIGKYAIKRMMEKGMMVDIDHMNQFAVQETLKMAVQYNYPVNSGHTGIRDPSATENQRTYRMLDTISRVGGLFGVGWSAQDAGNWIANYRKGLRGMHYRGVCFGSDANSVVFTPKPRTGSNVRYFDGFAAPVSFGHTWDYNRDGVAQYGMVRDFIRDLRNMGAARELNVLYSSAQEFYLMWQKCEASRTYIH